MSFPFQSYPPSLIVLSPRLTLTGDPGASVQGVNTTTLADGAFVYCEASRSTFRLDKADNTTVPDGTTVIRPSAGPGRWKLFGGGSGSAGLPFSGMWYVDPLTTATARDGTDEAPFISVTEAITTRVAAGDAIVQLMLVGLFTSYGGDAVVMPPSLAILLLESPAAYGAFPQIDSVAVGAQDGTSLAQTLVLGGVIVGEILCGPVCHVVVNKGGWAALTPHDPAQDGSILTVVGSIPQNMSIGANVFDAFAVVPDYLNAQLQMSNAQAFAPSGSLAQFRATESALRAGAVIDTGTALELDDCFVEDGAALSIVTDNMRLWNTQFEQGAGGGTTLTGGAGSPQLQVDGDTNWQIKNAPVTVTGFAAKVIQTDVGQSLRWFTNDSYLAGKFMLPGAPDDVMVASTEYRVLVPVPEGVSTCKSLRLRAANGPVADAACSFTVRLGNDPASMADTAMNASIAIGQSAATDLVHAFAVVPGQLLSLVCTSYPNPSGTPQFVCATLEFD